MWGDYMIKVLQIGMSYETGGTEVFLYNHYKVINKEEIQFDFIAYKDTMSFEEEVKEKKVKEALKEYDVLAEVKENTAVVEYDENEVKVGNIIAKLIEIANHINAIIAIVCEYPQCDECVVQLNECRKKIRKCFR